MKKIQLPSFILLFLFITNSLFSQTIVDADKMHPFHDGLAAVQKGDKWGFIDTTGKMLINYREDFYFGNNAYTKEPPYLDSSRCIIQ